MMPRTRRNPSGPAYIANESFVTRVKGEDSDRHVFMDRTRVYEGDPILETHAQYFDLVADRDYQTAA